MKNHDYFKLITPFLKSNILSKKSELFKLYISGENIANFRNITSYHMEASFCAASSKEYIKAIHVFRYPCQGRIRTLRNFINYREFYKIVNTLNKLQKTNFNCSLLKPIIQLKVNRKTFNDVIIFYFQFDSKTGRCFKISLHFSPFYKKLKEFLLNKFCIYSNSDIFNCLKNNQIELLGIDLFNDGKYNLKIYKRFEVLPKNLSFLPKKQIKKIMISDAFRSQKTTFLLYRFDWLGKRISLPGVYLYFLSKNILMKINNLKTFIDGKTFFNKILSYSNNYFVSWIAFKENELEFYIR